ncbi:glycosyltransferase family 2 protein [Formosa sediminum]|uniref:Glycosyltransferase family 2 protein n=1 Tax=Formosa sediminum TaxID=2594004 RepID=A0A516GRN8_9FLAO|nr:glycosyltransferase family 2 protein [Formosa sediminum]QDO94185.1 glycosyltransferase family 2 protein [Formosa sediminum]
MTFSLIVCTYMRPNALLNLLESVQVQVLYPDEILIIDGSSNNDTKRMLEANDFKNLKYYKVTEQDRGLTKQRNYGISKVSERINVVCFLDDDITLDTSYFENLIGTYITFPKALGVGGYITNEVNWERSNATSNSNYYDFDGWRRTEPLRFKIRATLGLNPDALPGVLPSFSHMRPISFLPPSGKVYPVELFMGGVASYKMSVFKSLSFSTYFEGYGLYEDADFCLRLSKIGQLYVNTAAVCEHHHEVHGRPNTYKYGKMIIRNGWYIWRVKYNNPKLKAKLKWHLTACLLMLLGVLGGLKSKNKNLELQEALGRFVGWWSLIGNKPKFK